MDVVQENIDELNATLSIKVKPEDYEPQVKKILNDYQKKASMPGFRPGKVPFGMIKKMYGNSVLAEELNKMLVDQLYKHIDDNKLPILGNPLPKPEKNDIDINNQKELEFQYDLALAPKFDVNLTEKDKYTKYQIIIDDELIAKYTKDIAKRYGKVGEGEVASDTDMVNGDFKELDKDGKEIKGGITHTSTVAIEFIEDKKVQKEFIGLKKEDTLNVDPVKVSKGPADMAAMLNISKPKAEKLTSKFSFTVKAIYSVEPAEVNQELWDKAFGPGNVTTEEEFKTKIKEELERAFLEDSDRLMKKHVADSLMEKLKLQLPDEFLKRWLLETNKETLDEVKLEEEYPEYSKSLRWQLIENKIIENNNLKVSAEEATQRAKDLFKQQMASYGYGEVDDEQLNEAAKNILGKEEDAKRIYEDLMDRKVMAFMKDTLTLKEKELSFDEFVKLASGKPAKGKILDKIGNLVKF
jgi:trigger factor